MQTLDIQNAVQQVRHTETPAAHATSADKNNKNTKESCRKSASFMEVLQHMMQKDSDSACPEIADGLCMLGDGEESTKKTASNGKKTATGLKNKTLVKKQVEDAGAESDQHSSTQDLHDSKKSPIAGLARENKTEKRHAASLYVQKGTEIGEKHAALPRVELETQGKKQKKRAEKVEKYVSLREGAATALHSQKRVVREDAQQTSSEDLAKKTAHARHVKDPKPVFTVIDERTVPVVEPNSNGTVHEAGTAVRLTQSPSLDMALDFRTLTAGSAATQSNPHTASEARATPFASLVAQQVQDMASDFVQAGHIVLQNNNAGIIRLHMQPAHLGNVRINLELTGNKKIIGKIVTKSKEAYEAFKESIGELSKAFEQGGFTSAEFDVSWSEDGSGRQFDGESGQFNELFAQTKQLEVMQHTRYADTGAIYAFTGDQAVNVFA